MEHKRLHIKTYVKSIEDFIELESTVKRAAGDIVEVKSTSTGLLAVKYTI